MIQKARDAIPKKTSVAETEILFALSGEELYGLQISDAIKSASDGHKGLRTGSLYTTLHRLEEKGLIESRWGDEVLSERGGARRRYYRLSGKGEATIHYIQTFHSRLLSWQPG